MVGWYSKEFSTVHIINQQFFSAGELLPKINKEYTENTPEYKYNPFTTLDFDTIVWYYENDAELFLIYCLKRQYDTYCKMQGRSANCNLYVPYLPNARMDRLKAPMYLFTLKWFCEVINNLNFNKVLVKDIHSDVSLSLLNNIQNISPDSSIESLVAAQGKKNKHYDFIYFPDIGAVKRYENIVKILNIPYYYGIKKREWATGEIKGIKVGGDLSLEKLKNKTVLIIDDICSKGDTFYYSSKVLKDQYGVKNIDLYVTHLENSIFDGELLKTDYIRHIYTTKSIFTKNHEKITVLKEYGPDKYGVYSEVKIIEAK